MNLSPHQRPLAVLSLSGPILLTPGNARAQRQVESQWPFSSSSSVALRGVKSLL